MLAENGKRAVTPAWRFDSVQRWNGTSKDRGIIKGPGSNPGRPPASQDLIDTGESIKMPDHLLTATEVSAQSGVSMGTVFRYKADGSLDEFMVGEGRTARFRRGAIRRVKQLQKQGLAMRGKKKPFGPLSFRG